MSRSTPDRHEDRAERGHDSRLGRGIPPISAPTEELAEMGRRKEERAAILAEIDRVYGSLRKGGLDVRRGRDTDAPQLIRLWQEYDSIEVAAPSYGRRLKQGGPDCDPVAAGGKT